MYTTRVARLAGGVAVCTAAAMVTRPRTQAARRMDSSLPSGWPTFRSKVEGYTEQQQSEPHQRAARRSDEGVDHEHRRDHDKDDHRPRITGDAIGPLPLGMCAPEHDDREDDHGE